MLQTLLFNGTKLERKEKMANKIDNRVITTTQYEFQIVKCILPFHYDNSFCLPTKATTTTIIFFNKNN